MRSLHGFIYHGECNEELFDLFPAAEFSNRTVRHKLKYHPHQQEERRNLEWNGLPAAVFLGRYDMKSR